ncbi:IKI3 family-domain-containing protein [Terfezia claveryi]|nr:IKI3 family-domain-containing protein [Terfezia claveryi]
MRNLLLTQRVHIGVSSTEIPDLPLTATAWDAATDSLICTFGPSGVESVIEVKRLQGQISNITSFDVPCELPSLKCDLVLSLHFFADTNTICIVFAGGNIVVVEVDENFASRGVEIVGSVDEGITGASWSPDEEVLAITTGASTFLLMTRSFENIATTTFTETDLQASNHVSVGWGKKETQFQGKRAKAMRDPTVPEYVDEGILSASDDGKVTISWRGDGAYLAISAVQNVEDKRRRIIRVYSREGTLDSVSEPVDRLEGTLSWRPSGNLIAGAQIFPDTSRIDVVFFERNGLRHGEFTMSIPGGSFEGQNIYQLAWNADSTVLAVVLKGRVQLWTMGNYHYYLKQEIMYDAEGSLNYPQDAPVAVWHPEKALQLALNLNDKVVVHSWIWSVHRGTTQSPNDHGMVAVIDGGKLKLTPLRWANVPPPIALYDIPLETTPIDVAVSYTEGLIAVLRSTGLDLIKWYPGKPRDAKKPKLTANATRFQALDSVRQIAFISSNRLAVLVDAIACCILLHYDIDFSSSTITKAGEDILPLGTTKIVPDALDATGELYYVENHRIVTSANDPSTKLEFPTTCPWVEVARIDGQVNYFGLSENGKLYANSTLIAPNCTSFVVTNAHLIYTTTQHFVKFVHLQMGGKDFEIPTDDPTGDERCRSIERGAKLVHVMPSSFSLTLQMPRGNLETIYPRALVVAGIRRSIEAKDYKTAFLACRSQRVDLNILHDHAPDQFLQNVELFIDQVKKVEHVDLFLSQLREEDVSQTMYRETLPQADVNKICNAFLDVMLPSRLSTKLQNIVTAYVCKSPPDHDAALLLIAKLREGNIELVEKAIEHVCWLADANKLYNNALGLYNLELTLLVAQQSQKDPREYLPFLQGLEELEHTRRRFVIDDHLGRHVKALRSLVDMGDETFEEAKMYIVKHALYQQALGLYKYKEDKQKELMFLYAEYLDEQSRFREAGLAYESIQHLRPALLAYRRANLWQQALSLALFIPISNSELFGLSESLADHLIEAKDFSSAAQIYVDYRNDIPEATRLLCRGSHFAEAMRLVANSGKPELLQSVVDAGLVEAFSTTVELLADCKAQTHAQLGRLRELRAKKEEDPLAYFEGLPEGSGANIPDNISLAPTDASTSGGTFMTRYTGKTAGTAMTGATRRTRTIYEEEYLVRSLARLVERLDIVKDEVGRLVEGMVRRGMRERATAVQEKMVEMGGILKGCVEEVFSDKNAVNLFLYGTGGCDGEGDDGEGGHGPMNVNGEKKIPVVKDFDRLAIL